MSTGAQILVKLRRALQEETGHKWEDPELYEHLNTYLARLASAVAQSPNCGHFQWNEQFTIAAGEEYVDLLAAGLAFTPAEILSLHHVTSSGEYVPMRPLPAGGWHAYRTSSPTSPDVTPLYGERRGLVANVRTWRLYAYPEANDTRTFLAEYRYVPGTLGAGTESPLDPQHDRLLVLGAALEALVNEKQRSPSLEMQLQKLEQQFLATETSTIGRDVPQGPVEVIGSDLFD